MMNLGLDYNEQVKVVGPQENGGEKTYGTLDLRRTADVSGGSGGIVSELLHFAERGIWMYWIK